VGWCLPRSSYVNRCRGEALTLLVFIPLIEHSAICTCTYVNVEDGLWWGLETASNHHAKCCYMIQDDLWTVTCAFFSFLLLPYNLYSLHRFIQNPSCSLPTFEKKITLKIGTCRSVNKKRGPPSYRILVTACIHTGGKDQHHLHHALVFSKPSTLWACEEHLRQRVGSELIGNRTPCVVLLQLNHRLMSSTV
jgi:hypothetical protein